MHERLLFRVLGGKFKKFSKTVFVVVSFTHRHHPQRGVWSRTHVSRTHIILIREDDFDHDDDASFWERCFCCWSDESEEYY